MLGFKIIKEMTNKELTEEVLSDQRTRLEKKSRDDLIRAVIQLRINRYQEQLLTEADAKQGFLGTLYFNKEDDD